jgi:hypothetical protein
MNTHRLDVSQFEHTQPEVTHCRPQPEEPLRFKWVPLIFALIVAGFGGLYWIHSA